MSEARYQTDEFLKLLTEALRAGPASPQWHEAVARLRQIDTHEADEYRLLIAAREDLESGREYRSVRPGAAFTRSVLDLIEQEAANGTRRMPSAKLIAILAALAALAVLIVVVTIALWGGGAGASVADLEKTYFSRPVVTEDFSNGIGAEWKTFGQAPVVSAREKGLRGVGGDAAVSEYAGGGICLSQPIPFEQSFAIETTVKITRPTSNVDLQLFVTEDPAFDARGMTPREFVVRLSGQEIGQRVEDQLSAFKPDVTLAGTPVPIGAGAVNLSIKMDRQFVVVEHDGKSLYAGPHGLSPGKARWPGVRFLARGPEIGLEDVTVQRVRVLKP